MNLIEMLKGQFTTEILGRLAGVIGIDAALLNSSLDKLLPILLGGIAAKGSTPQGALDLKSMLSSALPSDPAGALSALSGAGGPTEFLANGDKMVRGIFGDKLDGVLGHLGDALGFTKTQSASALGALAPLALGFLGKRASNGDIAGLIGRELPNLKGLIPGSLGNLLGLSGLGAAVAGATTGAARSVAGAVPSRIETRGMSPWIWAIPLAAVAALGWWFTRPPAVEVSSPDLTAVGKETGAMAKKGADALRAGGAALAELTRKLPGGIELKFPALSVEDRLLAFIEDTTKPIDEKTWFRFDRLEFDSGEATLRPSSNIVLDNVANILKAYPTVRLKIGGYTDNQGDQQMNLRLSQNRAETTRRALIDRGIDPSRLEAEGYGEKHPVGDNATEEGRQNNRRIDVRVLAR
jgi:outer membrane protein OmpA-like peptidoglycan-associated protein